MHISWDTKLPMMASDTTTVSKEFKCKRCQKAFSKKSNLKRHFARAHPSHKYIEDQEKSYNFPCEICNNKFNNKHHLLAHRRKKHDGPASCLNVHHECFFCHCMFKKSSLLSHYQTIHSCSLNPEKHNFSSIYNFFNWKKETEVRTGSKFIIERGKRERNRGRKRHDYYKCDRSGGYKTTRQSSEYLKIKRSKKTGYFCPARIDVFVSKDGSCSVEFINYHIGHSVSDNKDLLEEGIPSPEKLYFSSSLNKIRDSVYGSDLWRMHLLSEKELQIIFSIFNLNRECLKNTSLNSWIADILLDSEDWVFFCKPQGILSVQYPALKADDFLLIIMNDFQKEIVIKYGSNCICVDSIKTGIEVNSCKFELVTLLVITEGECFPCAFAISNKLNQRVASVFFSVIKSKTGIIKSKTFLSDRTDTFFNSWQKVMSQPEKRLFSPWHVDKAWRKHLIKMKNKEKQEEIYKILCSLLYESDSNSFHAKLFELKKYEENPDTLEFIKYFQEYFSNTELWACGINGLNITSDIECMHHFIKYVYTVGQERKRLDKVIDILMILMKEKVMEKLYPLFREQPNCNSIFIEDRHNAQINAEIKHENGGWLVNLENQQQYFIFKNNILCNCKLICKDCKICIHGYSCSCCESSLKWQMCKHIHFVMMQKNCIIESNGIPASNTLQTTVNESEDLDLLLSSSPSSTINSIPLTERIGNARQTYLEISDHVNSEEEYKILYESNYLLMTQLLVYELEKPQEVPSTSIVNTGGNCEILL